MSLLAAAGAQAQGREVPDSVKKAVADSIARADSVTGELPRSETPVNTEIGTTHRWNRDSLFAVGALTLADLLDRVPGLSSMRANYFMAPQVGAYNGDVARIRLFFDGIELDALDPRSRGVIDLTLFPIASLEELVVERGANELRIHMRSWRGPLRVTPETRADVYTGDNRSNTFRGFFAKRLQNGLAFQTMLQQRSTDDRRLGGDGDATSIMARVGLIRPSWSLDATLVRVRSAQQSLSIFGFTSYLLTGREIPRYDQVQQDALLRFNVGNTDRGRWLQLIASSRRNKENTPFAPELSSAGFVADSADTTATQTQIVAAAGWSTPRLRVSLTDRLRVVDGDSRHQPSGRIGIDLGRLTVAAYGERNPYSAIVRADVSGRLLPVPWFALTGAASYATSGTISVQTDTAGNVGSIDLPRARAVRAEAAIRVGRTWIQGGAVVRSGTILRPPGLFDRSTLAVSDGRATGATAAITGPLIRGFSAQANAVRWSDAGWYRPQTEARGELTWRHHWTGKTKTGGFDFELTGLVEYRSEAFVPLLRDDGTITPLPTFSGTPLGVRAEFTIKDATISVQLRNLLGQSYTTVPGLLMPQALSVYGVRWTFWN